MKSGWFEFAITAARIYNDSASIRPWQKARIERKIRSLRSYPKTKKYILQVIDSPRLLGRTLADIHSTDSKLLFEGPVKGTYSLAIVNRGFSDAAYYLLGDRVIVTSENEELDADSFSAASPSVRLRYQPIPGDDFSHHFFNNWPPAPKDLRGECNVLSCFAWEETSFPTEYVRLLNKSFDLICATSSFVRDALVNSGVAKPIFVCGNGVTIDWPQHNDNLALHEEQQEAKPDPKIFKFIHVSSCFPRKGVDILLRAYCEEFSGNDRVELIIKTFDNPHNNIYSLVDQAISRHSLPPAITVISKDLTSFELQQLYSNCHAAVFPTRGEGFLLPAAEAMLKGLIVITTRFGGHSDFCWEENSLLVEGRLARSESHVADQNSMWLEPDVLSLRAQMRKALSLDCDVKNAMVKNARSLIETSYTWDAVISRTIIACDSLKNIIARRQELRLLCLTSYRQKCGISTYLQYLLEEISSYFKDIKIISHDTHDLLPSDSAQELPHLNAVRLWKHTKEAVAATLSEISNSEHEVFMIQHHLGHYSYQDLSDLIKASRASGKEIIVEMHSSVVDYPPPGQTIADLRTCFRVIVHTLGEVQCLWDLDPAINACCIPHAIKNDKTPGRFESAIHPECIHQDSFRLASFGFAMPHKGLHYAIQAIHLLNYELDKPRYYLDLYCSCNGSEKTRKYIEYLNHTVDELNAHSFIRLDTSFKPIEEVLELLSESNALLFLYDECQESASGAIREVIQLNKLLITSKAKIFDEFSSISYRVDPSSVSSLADLIRKISNNPADYDCRHSLINRYIEDHSWKSVSKRYMSIFYAANDSYWQSMNLVDVLASPLGQS